MEHIERSPDLELDLLKADIKLLQGLLSKGTLCSEDLVQKYVAQISTYNHYLCAVISITPQDLLQEAAQKLDKERQVEYIRGPLHGIPILIKVNYSMICG
jgi:amidase